MKFSKVIDIEDFSNQALIPYFNKILSVEMSLDLSQCKINHPVFTPDAKNWKTAMALHAFDEFIPNVDDKLFAGIGAGTELLTELLAQSNAIVFPVDRYLEQTAWSDAAPPGYMLSTKPYNQIDHIHENIIPVHSDARCLELPSAFFDGVYSCGAIEHFGSIEAIQAAASEIGRVLKPGGIASISTEFRLDGPANKKWFDDNCILFTVDMIEEHIVKPSGLMLVDKPDNLPSPKTYETRRNLADFLQLTKKAYRHEDNDMVYPNLIIEHDGFLFCSIHLLLKKPLDSQYNQKQHLLNNNMKQDIQDSVSRAIVRLSNVTTPSLIEENVPSSTQTNTAAADNISALLSNNFLKKIRARVEKYPFLRRLILKSLKRFPSVLLWLKSKTRTTQGINS